MKWLAEKEFAYVLIWPRYTSLPLQLKEFAFAFPPFEASFIVSIPLAVWQPCRHVHFPYSVLQFNLVSQPWPIPNSPRWSLCCYRPRCVRFPIEIMKSHCLIERMLGSFAACIFPWTGYNIQSNVAVNKCPKNKLFFIGTHYVRLSLVELTLQYLLKAN